MALIDQQEVINAIEKCHKRCCRTDSNGDEWIHYETALNELEALPTVQPKRGKWKGYNTDKEGWKRTDGSPVFMSCSECNGVVLNNGSAHWNFCPNCGADMRCSENPNS